MKASKKHSPEELNEFWKFIPTIRWNDQDASCDAQVIQKRLLCEISPILAEKYNDIKQSIIDQLIIKLKPPVITLIILAGINNIIGRGQEAVKAALHNSALITTYINAANVKNHFGICIPTYDDYMLDYSIEVDQNDELYAD